MDYVIGLSFSGLPATASVPMPSGFHAARASNPHFIRVGASSSLSVPKLETRGLSFRYCSHLPVSWSSGGRHRPLQHIVGPRCSASNDEMGQHEQQLGDKIKRWQRNLHNEIIDSVNELKDHENFNLALKLLKTSEQFFEDEDSLATIRFMIMEILYSQGNYQEAFDYWIRLYERNEHSPQLQKQLFTDMKCHLFSTMIKVLECLKGKMYSKDISPGLLRSMNDLKNMDLPKSMNIHDGIFPPSKPPDEGGSFGF